MRAVLLNTGADGAKEENEMNKRFLAAILACLLLTGCGARRTEPLSEEPAASCSSTHSYSAAMSPY